MAILVIAEHDNHALSAVTLNVISAASRIDATRIHVLVAGSGARAVADEALKLAGVHTVLLADAPHLKAQIAEHVEATVLTIAKSYSPVFLPPTSPPTNLPPPLPPTL